MTKVLMQTRNDEYKSNLILSKGLDFVEEEEQITHQTFKFDPNDLGNEEEYISVKAEIQGKDSKEPSGHYLLMCKVEVHCGWSTATLDELKGDLIGAKKLIPAQHGSERHSKMMVVNLSREKNIHELFFKPAVQEKQILTLVIT
ncbi:uncharacterized protein HD556DRAFT_1309728 [Suillus plorans]|uniref:Uncharacterized protein n=1 Tax=Suillus plorans TaxID=116603 RepID=A0A9P7ALE1_9AGAM|nr:uncharacterized protein HD556DRAFT_1309728 [Suillus plorans]KAG1791650.1 hypothetical protein HD556DRAFT_1309728 [Suillus plorans]